MNLREMFEKETNITEGYDPDNDKLSGFLSKAYHEKYAGYLEEKVCLLDTCHWIQIREGLNSHWVSSCGGKNLNETFDLCPLCQKEVSKTFI